VNYFSYSDKYRADFVIKLEANDVKIFDPIDFNNEYLHSNGV